MTLKDLDKLENDLIEKFKKHPVITGLNKISDSNFKKILLQRRYISYLSFMPLYDLAIDGLRNNNRALKVSRLIEREEYPGKDKTKSHRELYFDDLLDLGLTEEEIYMSVPTQETLKHCLDRIFMSIKKKESLEMFQIKLLMTLRLSGELFTSVDCHELARRIGKKAEKTKFFWAHYTHDRKKMPLYKKAIGKSHSDAFVKAIQDALDTEDKIKYAAKVANEAYKVRIGFYDQFKNML